jgi:hypothetical protein
MLAGDTHLAFAEAAARDDIVLTTDATFDWLAESGHILLEDILEEPPPTANVEALRAAAEALDEFWVADLRGDIDVLVACRTNLLLPVDLLHEPTGTVIEIDESLHFTSHRLTTLDRYPADAPLGFDPDVYRELCREWAPKMDGYSRAQAAKGFGIGGIQRERAYRDALRDLAAPAMGHPPVVRLVAVDGDGTAVYERNQESLMSLLGAAR